MEELHLHSHFQLYSLIFHVVIECIPVLKLGFTKVLMGARLMGLQMVVMVKHIHIFRLGGGVVLENALTLKLIYI